MNANAQFAKRASRLVADKRSDADASCRALGCPYTAFDPRAVAWIEGYKAGLAFMEEAIKP